MKLLRREIWKAITDFPGYEVSTWGRVRSYWKQVGLGSGNGRGVKTILSDTPQKILKNNTVKGYSVVSLYKDGKDFRKKVHKLVLETFIGPCPKDHMSRHLDGKSNHNELTNLCWGTGTENQNDRIGHGTSSIGELQGASKLTEKRVLEIRNKLSKGRSLTALGEEYGVTTSTIWQIDRNKIWKHI